MKLFAVLAQRHNQVRFLLTLDEAAQLIFKSLSICIYLLDKQFAVNFEHACSLGIVNFFKVFLKLYLADELLLQRSVLLIG